MTRINLSEIPWREDWKSFLSADQQKQHWIAQRLLEDERDLQETVQPEPKPYEKPKKEKLTLIQIIQFPKAFLP